MTLNISFISGTRADYGKIRPYIDFLSNKENKKIHVFVTGMNVLKKYGETYKFINEDLKEKTILDIDKSFKEKTTIEEINHIITQYNKHIQNKKIDFIFVHGDRPEVLAACIAGTFNNIPICHIEAGDISGSVDEAIRHASSKLSHRFLVGDKKAKNRLIKMGENPNSIFITGNASLSYKTKKSCIKAPFETYAILIYHPVTTLSKECVKEEIEYILKNLEQTHKKTIVILPNNDLNQNIILESYKKYKKNKNFKFYKSLKFDDFQKLLKNADFLIGNSSCGIKEAPYYNIPVINIGCRQNKRFEHLKLKNFYNIQNKENLQNLIQTLSKKEKRKPNKNSNEFYKKLENIFTEEFFAIKTQKTFYSK